MAAVVLLVARLSATGLVFAAVVVFATRPPRVGLVTTVGVVDVVEVSEEAVRVLELLTARWGEDGADGTGRGGGSILPFGPAAVIVDASAAGSGFSREAVRLSFPAFAAPRLACSIIP